MQAWKLGLLVPPAIAGVAIGAKQIFQTNSENESLPKIDTAPPEPEDTKPQTELQREPQSEPNLSPQTLPSSRPRVQVTLNQRPHKVQETQKVDFSKPLFNKLHDYTFKLMTPCSWGTGWILDYQIPKNESNYPLVWYIATAAHVVKNWYFDQKKNTYEQELPVSCKPKSTKDFYVELARRDEEESPKKGLKSPKKQKVKHHRLFWTAFNLFEPDSALDIKDNNFKDFVVLEVTFEDAKTAKEITRNFAKRYTTKNFSDQLDIFGEALSPSKTTGTENKNFYSLGYPRNDSDELFLKSNWSEGGEKGDTLSNDPRNHYHISPKDKVRGFVSAKHFQAGEHEFKWGDKQYNEFGHFYYMNGTKLGRGASGSMVVDEKGKVLGVRALESNYSLYTPLRSGAVTVGEIKTPAYDLISGVTGQKSSYKKQVENYLLKNDKKTWLSSIRNWTKPDTAVA